MKTKLLWLLLAVLPMAANAQSGDTTTIISFVVDTADQLIRVNGSWANPGGCGLSNFFVIQMSSPNYKDLLSAVMMASATGGTAGPWFSGCVNTPWGNAPVASIIEVNSP